MKNGARAKRSNTTEKWTRSRGEHAIVEAIIGAALNAGLPFHRILQIALFRLSQENPNCVRVQPPSAVAQSSTTKGPLEALKPLRGSCPDSSVETVSSRGTQRRRGSPLPGY